MGDYLHSSATRASSCCSLSALRADMMRTVVSVKVMFLDLANISFTDTTVRIMSALNAESQQQLEALAAELCT